MPNFEYVCNDCGTRFEKLHKEGAVDAGDCPACGSAAVAKALSLAAGTASPAKSHRGG